MHFQVGAVRKTLALFMAPNVSWLFSPEVGSATGELPMSIYLSLDRSILHSSGEVLWTERPIPSELLARFSMSSVCLAWKSLPPTCLVSRPAGYCWPEPLHIHCKI